jgi:hypothetical protein
MTVADRPAETPVTPLLFSKLKPADPSTAAQYAGTDTELDTKVADRFTSGSSSSKR